MKKYLTVLTVSLLFISTVSAQSICKLPMQDAPDDNVFNRYDSSLGICGYFDLAGVACLSYQHWATPEFGYCVSAGALYEPSSVGFKPELEFAAFCQLSRALYTASSPVVETRLYIWGLGGFDALQNRYYRDDVMLANGSLALGIGLDVTSLNHVSVPLEFGYAVQGPDTFRIGPTGSIGVRYRY